MKALNIGCMVFLLFFNITSEAAIIAYRAESSTLFVVPDDKSPDKVFKIDRVTGNYQVGNDIVAFRKGSSLYIASTLSDWKPLLVSSQVISFEVQWSTVVFRKGSSLYVVRHPAPQIAFGELVSKKIVDYSLWSDERGFARQMITHTE